MLPDLVAGVPGTAAEVANWNNLIVSSGVADYVGSYSGTLKLSDGSDAVGSAVNWSWHGHQGAATNNDLFDSNWDPFDWTPDLTLNMTDVPFRRYDLYVYQPAAGYTAAARGGEVLANGQSRLVRMFPTDAGFPKYVESTLQGPYGGDPNAVPEATYLHFENVSGDLTLTTDSKFGSRLRVAGVQLVQTLTDVGGENTVGDTELQTTIEGGTFAPLSGAQVIRISQNLDDFLHLREIVAQESGGGDAALLSAGATITGSPQGHDGVIDKSINGIIETPFGSHSAATTDSGAPDYKNFERVELSGPRDLESITVYNRNDGSASRGRNLQLRVYGDLAETNLLADRQLLGQDLGPDYKIEVDLTSHVGGGTAVGSLEASMLYVMEIDAETPASDRLIVPQGLTDSTRLVVDGELEVELVAGTPNTGQVFQLLVADSIVGQFDAISLPELTTPALFWDTSNLYTTGELLVGVPEPSNFALGALGLLGLLGWRWRRKR